MGLLCQAVSANKITLCETSALLRRVEQFHTSPFLALVHESARIEATLANAAAAIGMDFMFTPSEGPAAAPAAFTPPDLPALLGSNENTPEGLDEPRRAASG